MRWWAIRIVLAGIVGVVLALAIDIVRQGGPEAWLVRRGLPPPYAATGAIVEVNGIATYIEADPAVFGSGEGQLQGLGLAVGARCRRRVHRGLRQDRCPHA